MIINTQNSSLPNYFTVFRYAAKVPYINALCMKEILSHSVLLLISSQAHVQLCHI